MRPNAGADPDARSLPVAAARMWWILAAVAAAALACLSWGWIEARVFTVRRVVVPVLPPASAPLRILHVSDIHLDPRQGRKIRWLRGLAALKPDVVVNTGDNLGRPDAVGPVLDALGPLLACPGVFVNGSNDYFAPRPQNPFTYFRGPTGEGARRELLPTGDLIRGFVDAGWIDLNNARGAINVRGLRVSFVGVDDPHIGRDSMPGPGGRLGVVHIGVAHAPYARILEGFRVDGVDLVLAGHTHGGQVRIPGIGALVTNCDIDRGRARGLSRWPGRRLDEPGGEDSIWIHVSAGVGTSPFAPIRFACRPEATLVTLSARGEG